MNYLVDTNVLIDAQSKRLPLPGLNFLSEIINENFNISFITYIEFLGYQHISSMSKEFIQLANMIYANKAIVEISIQIRKENRIKIPDAIIAATALTYSLTLISHNLKDFQNIEGLRCVDPYMI